MYPIRVAFEGYINLTLVLKESAAIFLEGNRRNYCGVE
jgi:hypothetical protein